MALFQRLFVSKKRHTSAELNPSPQKQKPPKLDKEKIRLVIFSESDRGRTPYFDSNAIKPFEEPAKVNAKPSKISIPLRCSQERQPNGTQQRPSPKYHFHRLGSDVKVLEEMMFGTVAMAFKGSTLKIHLLRSPPQLMVSKVFIPEKPCRENTFDNESDAGSLPGSTADLSSGEFSLMSVKKPTRKRYARSIPVDVPSKDLLSDYSTDDDSGLASFTSSGSLRTSSFPSPSNNSLSSYSSLHRRWMRAQITSLDGYHRQQDGFMVPPERSNRSRRNKLAIAIVFGSEDETDEESHRQFQNFFFSHFALVEGHVEKLRSSIETVYFNTRNFLPSTIEALELFRNSIYDLYMAPRLPEPVWLTMMSATTYKIKLCEKFIECFTLLATKFDNKNCKFFVSTLLSAVLTQHLAWVATVTPAGGVPAHTYQDKHSAKWIDTLAKTHPYNPLWAQLGDLFGAIGVPRKISRTVVVGKKADIVKKLLYMLSYFIRCSEVHENTDPQCLAFIVNDPHLDVSLSPTSSEKTLVESTTRGRTPTLSAGSSSGGVPSSAGTFRSSATVGNSQSDGSLVNQTHLMSLLASDCPVGSMQDRNFTTSSQAVFHSVGSSSDREPSLIVSKPSCGSCTKNDVDDLNNKIISSCDKCKISRQYSQKASSSIQRSEQSLLEKSVLQSNSSCVNSLLHSDTSPLDSTTIVPLNSQSSIGMSELHNYIPHSLPCGNILYDKCNLSQTTSPSAAMDSISLTSSSNISDFSDLGADQFIRSQSFSGGAKFKSKLSQQLEVTAAVQASLETSKIKAADVKILLGGDSEGITSSSSGLGRHEREAELSTTSVNMDVKKEGEIKQTGNLGRPTTLARHQSVPSGALGRRRHLSSTGSIDYEVFDPLIHCKEVKMPFGLEACGNRHVRAFDRNFGRSLLAGYSDHYLSDFVLQGTSDVDYKQRLLNDLQTTVKHSILDEPIDEAVCIIADTDNWTVEVASSKVMGMSPSGCTSWTSSKLVADLIESVVEFSRLKMSAEFCLMHLEDRLQEIYFKSLMLSEYLTGAATYSQRELTSMLGFETSDMALLMAVAGTHTPGLALMLNS